MLLAILIVCFVCWASNIQYIDGKWVNVKKLRNGIGSRSRTTPSSIIAKSIRCSRSDMTNVIGRIFSVRI